MSTERQRSTPTVVRRRAEDQQVVRTLRSHPGV